MNRNSFAHAHFKQNGTLCVNVLSSDHQALSGVFANASLRSEERFCHDSWQVMASGAPVLSSAVASFDCLIDGLPTKWAAIRSSTAGCRRFAAANSRAGWSISTVAITPSVTKHNRLKRDAG
ncbi:FMN reductase (NADH) RutF [Kluyvera cryocrescens]|uniref:FMN reductase (NADH) RutF n=1 Tax=Kluyvera cryocrescens TaxID=580 RepID=A0A485BMM7_KLUCR|nr:FMN reductase (NADH) RutF [Kluyvera cryocrescens]